MQMDAFNGTARMSHEELERCKYEYGDFKALGKDFVYIEEPHLSGGFKEYPYICGWAVSDSLKDNDGNYILYTAEFNYLPQYAGNVDEDGNYFEYWEFDDVDMIDWSKPRFIGTNTIKEIKDES